MTSENDFREIEAFLKNLGSYEMLGRVLGFDGYVMAMHKTSGNLYEIRPGMKARRMPDIEILGD